MSKEEIRSILRAEGSAAGDSAFEIEQLRRLQESQAEIKRGRGAPFFS